jgi:low molecular weight protein-tyrosine phosphatase
MSLSILVVCTGNVCRSPVAEQLLTVRLADAGVDPAVRSAGTRALIGEAMTREALELSARYGGGGGKHVAMQLTAALIGEADLVLTASREHRAEVASLVPRAARKAYTLREFARITEFLGSDAESNEAFAAVSTPEELIELVLMSRGFAAPQRDATDDDIVDPYRRSAQVYEEAGRVIDAATATIAQALSTASRFGSRGAA